MITCSISYSASTASAEQIRQHLLKCDEYFRPSLSSRLDIAEYANKLREKARNIEAWSENNLVGLVSIYINVKNKTIFISNVSVAPSFAGKGIASTLMKRALYEGSCAGCGEAILEVSREAVGAISLYTKLGFTAVDMDVGTIHSIRLTKSICRSEDK